jgi:hypothetical protein
MENITVELQSKKYLLVEVLCTASNERKLKALFKKYGCIHQGIKEIKTGGFLTPNYAIAKYLVPEENVIAFNNEND